MKKTLLATAVVLAFGASMTAQAQDGIITAPKNATTAGGGAQTTGALSPASNSAKGSYNRDFEGSLNVNATQAFNDINSHNDTTIAKDGIVASAQKLDQAIAASDLNHIVGDIAKGNIVLDNGNRTDAALSPITIKEAGTNGGNKVLSSNAFSNGAFNHYSGVASASQNLGHTTAVGQSVVVQSNGSI